LWCCTYGVNSRSRRLAICSRLIQTRPPRDTDMHWASCESQSYRGRIPVPDLDDEQFEAYLKGFRPLLPDALPVRELMPERHRQPHFILAAAALGTVATLLLAVASFRILSHHSPSLAGHFRSVQGFVPGQPLTLRDANSLLATAPSYKFAMDELASPRQSSTVPKEKESALATLAREKIKL
jgi:hypothetical protein